jgi:CBS domain-containing protein
VGVLSASRQSGANLAIIASFIGEEQFVAEEMMQVSSVMSRDVQTIASDHTLQHAASAMRRLDAGVLPVEENDKLIGMITDRDIAIRGVADGMGPDAKVRDAMTY